MSGCNMNIKTIELPAYWASALVNNDFEHCDEREGLEAQEWLEDNPKVDILMCSDESYIGRHDGLMCDMLTYSYIEG
jgi:hypothetical protein